MLLDVRTYTCRPGTIKKHLALYDRLGKGPQTKHLGQPFAYLVTETGNLEPVPAHLAVRERGRPRAAPRGDAGRPRVDRVPRRRARSSARSRRSRTR